MPAELVLFSDAAMNACILLSVQLGLGRMSLKRLIAAMGIMCVDTVLCRVMGIVECEAWYVQGPFLICAGAALSGWRDIRSTATTSACILLATTAFAGLRMLSSSMQILLIVPGCLLIIFLLRLRTHDRAWLRIEVCVEMGEVRECVCALIDTGNRLREHSMNLPVLIVQRDAMPRIASTVAAMAEDEVFTLPFGVLGSSGSIGAFRPDRITVRFPDGTEADAPPCLVALFPDRIPGMYRALAPAEFLHANHWARRLSHGIFKRKTIHIRSGSAYEKGIHLLYRRQRSSASSIDAGRGD